MDQGQFISSRHRSGLQPSSVVLAVIVEHFQFSPSHGGVAYELSQIATGEETKKGGVRLDL
jgi:hypothetical protein